MDSVKKIVYVAALMIALAIAIPVAISAFSSGPPDARTGAPGESTCMACHSPGTGGNGSVAISANNGLFTGYTLNTIYMITVTLQDPGQQRWGFECTAIDSSGNGAGQFTITDLVNTQLSNNPAPARDYVKHTSTGTFLGTLNGPVSWNFDWTAPSSSIGPVRFYVAGNAANGNFANTGDFIYLTSAVAAPPPLCQGRCGDANKDGSVNVSDAVWIINFVFAGGGPPLPVRACGDANSDGSANVSDAVWVINFVFAGGGPPGNCRPDLWADDCCPF